MYLVFDVGGTFIKYALLTEDGDIIEKKKAKTPMEPEGGIDDFINLLVSIYESYKKSQDIQGIAIALPGQVDVENGIVYGGGGLRYTHNVKLGEILSQRCDGIRVALENDGHAAALAELWKGNAKDAVNACVLVFGTGIGCGIIINRKIYSGRGLQAGEISFIYDDMKRDRADKVCSIDEMTSFEDEYKNMPVTWAIRNSVRSLCYRVSLALGLNAADVNGEMIYECVRQGNKTVIEIMEDYYFDIARYCCNLYMTLNPDVILIGGGISAQPDFAEGIKKYAKKLSGLSRIYDDMKIDVCHFRNDSNLIGALFNFKSMYDLI